MIIQSSAHQLLRAGAGGGGVRKTTTTTTTTTTLLRRMNRCSSATTSSIATTIRRRRRLVGGVVGVIDYQKTIKDAAGGHRFFSASAAALVVPDDNNHYNYDDHHDSSIDKEAFPYIHARQQERKRRQDLLLFQQQQQQQQPFLPNIKKSKVEDSFPFIRARQQQRLKEQQQQQQQQHPASSPPSTFLSSSNDLMVPPSDLNPLLSVSTLNNNNNTASSYASSSSSSSALLLSSQDEEEDSSMDDDEDDLKQRMLSSPTEDVDDDVLHPKMGIAADEEDDDDDIAPDIRRLILEYAGKEPTPASLETLIRVGQGDDDASFWRPVVEDEEEEEEEEQQQQQTTNDDGGAMIGLHHNKAMANKHGQHRLALLRILMQTARFLRREIPIRLAHRIDDLDKVPLMHQMPAVRGVKRIYIDSFLEIIQFTDVIETAADEEHFATLLSSLYRKHANVLVQMAKGAYQFREKIQADRILTESNQHVRNDQYHVDDDASMVRFEKMEECHQFLDRFYLSRIGIRVLAGQYLALRSDFQERQQQNGGGTINTANGVITAAAAAAPSNTAPHTHSSMSKDLHSVSDYVGMICERTNTVQIVRQAAADATYICRRTFGGRAPMIHVHGNLNLTFPFIPTYLHYILLELLKNALRATMDRHAHTGGRIPPVTVIIADGTENEDVVIKIMDEGGGIPRSHMHDIWSYLYTTADPKVQKLFLMDDDAATSHANPHGGVDDIDDDSKANAPNGNNNKDKKQTTALHNASNTKNKKDHGTNSPLAGLGYGLPISRDYCRYFGGDLDLISMEGFGTDAFIHLKRVGDSIEPVP